MSPHPSLHFYWTLGLLAATAVAAAVVRHESLRRRLAVAMFALAAAVLVHEGILHAPAFQALHDYGWQIEGILLAFAVINAVVALVLNPWIDAPTRKREPTPAIVQDTVVVVLVLVAAMFIVQSSNFFLSLTGSAIVVGLALQDTLGNAFSGLAIQIEKPFRVGHWISVANYDGRVVEITWRATRVRTKAGNIVSVPNSTIIKEAINNYSEPTAPTQLYVDVGATYAVPPNTVKDAILNALKQSPRVLAHPAPEVLLYDFAASAMTYRTRFWIDQFEFDEQAKDEVRRGIYYEFARGRIEIPYPIQVEYPRHETREPDADRIARFATLIARVPVFDGLYRDGHQALAAASAERLFGDGEVVVRQGDAGASMFVVCRGQVSVTIDQGREVARIKDGGVFGEMSLLTGDPRTATVTAAGDVTVLEISADAFREFVAAHPDVIDQLAERASTRRRELDETRAAAVTTAADAKISLVRRMRKFFGL